MLSNLTASRSLQRVPDDPSWLDQIELESVSRLEQPCQSQLNRQVGPSSTPVAFATAPGRAPLPAVRKGCSLWVQLAEAGDGN